VEEARRAGCDVINHKGFQRVINPSGSEIDLDSSIRGRQNTDKASAPYDFDAFLTSMALLDYHRDIAPS
jgi:hypothetical protein